MLHLHMTETFASALASSHDHLVIVPMRHKLTAVCGEGRQGAPTHSCSSQITGLVILSSMYSSLSP